MANENENYKIAGYLELIPYTGEVGNLPDPLKKRKVKVALKIQGVGNDADSNETANFTLLNINNRINGNGVTGVTVTINGNFSDGGWFNDTSDLKCKVRLYGKAKKNNGSIVVDKTSDAKKLNSYGKDTDIDINLQDTYDGFVPTSVEIIDVENTSRYDSITSSISLNFFSFIFNNFSLSQSNNVCVIKGKCDLYISDNGDAIGESQDKILLNVIINYKTSDNVNKEIRQTWESVRCSDFKGKNNETVDIGNGENDFFITEEIIETGSITGMSITISSMTNPLNDNYKFFKIIF